MSRAALPFTGPQGHPVPYNDFRYCAWDRAVEGMLCDRHCKAEGEVHRRIPFTPHDQRHGNKSWLLDDGIPLTVVRDRMGQRGPEYRVSLRARPGGQDGSRQLRPAIRRCVTGT